MPALKVDDRRLITPHEKATALAAQFSKNHENPLANENITFTRHVDTTVNRFMRNSEETPTTPELATCEEVKIDAKRLKNPKAPGMDRVHNRLIKKLPSEGFIFLTLIVNACLTLKTTFLLNGKKQK